MLFNSILKSLRCAVHVPTITAAHELVYDHAFLNGRHSVFPNCSKHFVSGETDREFHSTVAYVELTLAIFSEILPIQGSFK